MGKAKKAVKKVGKSVSKGLSQIDPTTKEGLLNISTMGTYGMANEASERLGLGKGPEKPKESSSEKAAAEVAVKEYDFARQMDFVKDEYANRVERLGSEQMQDAVSGRANIDVQNQGNDLAGQVQTGLAQVGVDPSSGRSSSAMTAVQDATGQAVGNAQAESEFALDSAYLEGQNNRIAMAMGEKTKAVAGLQDIAQGANQLAAQKAFGKFNSKAATSAALGTAAGMAGQAYMNRKPKPE